MSIIIKILTIKMMTVIIRIFHLYLILRQNSFCKGKDL